MRELKVIEWMGEFTDFIQHSRVRSTWVNEYDVDFDLSNQLWKEFLDKYNLKTNVQDQ